jgi:hypothetical protein
MVTMMNDFVAFIISHGRPNKIITYNVLRNKGYSGRIVIIIDDQDKNGSEYIEKYGDDVVIFNKQQIADTIDRGDNFNDLRTTTHARNAAFGIARDLGYKYFIVLDDDYTKFDYRFNRQFEFKSRLLTNLDSVWEAMLTFYKKVDRLLTLAMSQGGDFIGGKNSSTASSIKLKRKAMNSFICSVDRPFNFISRLNEDVNTYISLGSRGYLFFTTNQVMLTQLQTQSNTGGMTETYLDSGTYVKSFYSVMYQPSSVKIRQMSGRLHHSIDWKSTVPKIIEERWRKSRPCD